MAKLTLDALRKMREEKQHAMSLRESQGKDIQVVVGMGTCGIAAGAKDAFNAIMDELAAKNIQNVLVRQVGCMGLCHSEPTIQVMVPEMPDIIYGDVTAEVAKQIIDQHVMGKTIVKGAKICPKPSTDIMQ